MIYLNLEFFYRLKDIGITLVFEKLVQKKNFLKLYSKTKFFELHPLLWSLNLN
jgi:hypothetical protein